MKKLREFREYTLEQVEEVARSLYALAPFDVNTSEKMRWNLLAQQAFDFLDNFHKACDEIAKRRRQLGEHYAAVTARLARAEKLPPDIVSFDHAARFVTREKRTARALPKFEKLLRLVTPRYTTGPEIKRWRKTGIPHSTVRDLQRMHEAHEEALRVTRQNRAKATRHTKRHDKRRGAKTPELRTALKIPSAT